MTVAGTNLTIAIGPIAAKPGRARDYNVKALREKERALVAQGEAAYSRFVAALSERPKGKLSARRRCKGGASLRGCAAGPPIPCSLPHGRLRHTNLHPKPDRGQPANEFVGSENMLPDRPVLPLAFPGDLGQPDHRLDGFDLTEERTHILEGVVPPMREQAGRRSSVTEHSFQGIDTPAAARSVTYVSGTIRHLCPRSFIVLLLRRREVIASIQNHPGLVSGCRLALLARSRNRRNQFRTSPAGYWRQFERLAIFVERVVADLRPIRGIQYGVSKKRSAICSPETIWRSLREPPEPEKPDS